MNTCTMCTVCMYVTHCAGVCAHGPHGVYECQSNLPQVTQCSGKPVPQEVLSPSVSLGLYFEHSWTWQRGRSPDSQEAHLWSETACELSPLKSWTSKMQTAINCNGYSKLRETLYMYTVVLEIIVR